MGGVTLISIFVTVGRRTLIGGENLKPAFQRIFWGFLIVFIDVQFEYVDFIADPIGYFLVFTGLKLISREFLFRKYASWTSLFLIFFSIPAIFINTNRLNELPPISGMNFYVFTLSMGDLLLISYIFKLMLEIASYEGQVTLLQRIHTIFILYLTASVSTLIIQPLLWGYATVFLIGISLATEIVAFVMHIIFLVQLLKFPNKRFPQNPMKAVMPIYHTNNSSER